MSMGDTTGTGIEYVEAVRHYQYTNDRGETFAIENGQHYILLQKTNNDWWHVKERSGDQRDLYVPTKFVRCVENPPDDDEVFSGSGDESGESSGSEQYDSAEDQEVEEEENEPIKIVVPKGKKLPDIPIQASKAIPIKNTNRLSTFKPPIAVSTNTPPADYDADYVKTQTPPKLLDQDIKELPMKTIQCIDLPPPPRGPTFPPPAPPSIVVPPRGGDEVSSRSNNSGTEGDRGYEPVRYANLDEIRGIVKIPDSELQASTEYANLSTIQAAIRPAPIPDPENFTKALGDNWGVYTDTESGRPLYYNTFTHETTWKPPRIADKQNPDRENNSSTEDKDPRPNGSVHAMRPLPRGWSEEKTEAGNLAYVNQTSKEKWFALVDKDGRQYFYMEGSQESAWQLPELIGHSQSVSDSLSHVDVEARKAAFCKRSSKSKSMYVDTKERQEALRKSTTLPANMTRSIDVIVENNNSPIKEDDLKEGQSFTSQVFLMEPKDGMLNKTKVMENGKKIKKNWSQSYVMLSGSNLVFYKDQKAAAQRPGSPHGKPDFMINLLGAKVEFGSKDMSSKKNVILVSSNRPSAGTQYLLQADDYTRVHNWYIALSQAVQVLEQGLELPYRIPGHIVEEVKKNGSPPTATEPGEKLKRGKSTKGLQKNPGAQKNTQKSPSTQKNLHRNASVQRSISADDVTNQERKRRIRDILFNFITRRPSPEVLKEKGIIKDGLTVFGCDLAQLCEREKSPVPSFVKQAILALDNRGLDHDGLYRVNGNASQIQKLRFKVDQEEHYDLDDADLWDVHVLTGALKLFFRELKCPLFPFNFYDKLVAAIQLKQCSAKLKAFKDLTSVLPKCHYETAKLLFSHLINVTEQSKENRMQTHNLAIVFGPTLLWPAINAPNMAVSLVFQNRIVEFFLLEYGNIFG